MGLVKAALFIGSCFAKLENVNVGALFPNSPAEREQTEEDVLEVLEAIDRWPVDQLEP